MLALVVFMLRSRFFEVFGSNFNLEGAEELKQQSVGAAGLAQQYSKIILLAERIMEFPFMGTTSSRSAMSSHLFPQYGIHTEEAAGVGVHGVWQHCKIWAV